MNRNLTLGIVGAIIALVSFASPANAQWQGRRGGTGYDGGAGSRGQAYYFRDYYGISPNPYKGGSGCMPPPPPCYNGCGNGGGWGGGGGGGNYGYPGTYRSTSWNVGVNVGVSNGRSSSGWGSNRFRQTDIGVGFNIGQTTQKFTPAPLPYNGQGYQPQTLPYYGNGGQPQPLYYGN